MRVILMFFTLRLSVQVLHSRFLIFFHKLNENDGARFEKTFSWINLFRYTSGLCRTSTDVPEVSKLRSSSPSYTWSQKSSSSEVLSVYISITAVLIFLRFCYKYCYKTLRTRKQSKIQRGQRSTFKCTKRKSLVSSISSKILMVVESRLRVDIILKVSRNAIEIGNAWVALSL